jgi:hypothetical protein
MIGLLKAETLKLSSRKLFPVLTLVILAFAGLFAFIFLLLGQILEGTTTEGPPIIPKPMAFLFGIQQVVGQTWFPLILAVVVFGGELATTVWATTLTRESRRSRQVGARVVILSLASWLAMLLGVALWSGLAAIFAEGSGGPAVAEWLGVVWKACVTQVPWVTLGIGTVALLRSVGPAIGGVLALSIGESLLVFWSPYRNVSLTGATTGIFGDAGLEGVPGAELFAQPVGLLHSVAILAIWTGLGLLLTWWGLNRRDA